MQGIAQLDRSGCIDALDCVASRRAPGSEKFRLLPWLAAIALLALPLGLLALWLGWPWWWAVTVCLGVGGMAAALAARRSVLTAQRSAWVTVAVLAWLPCWSLLDESKASRTFLIIGIGVASGLLALALLGVLRAKLGSQLIDGPPHNGQRRHGLWVIQGLAALYAIQAVFVLGLGGASNNLDAIDSLAGRGLPIVSQARYASELMRSRYLWQDELANRNLQFFGDPAAVVQRMHGPKDRWSHVARVKDDSQSRSGKYLSNGLELKREHADQWLVWDAQPGSPAESHQLVRGDTVLSIDNLAPEKWLQQEAKGKPSPDALSLHIRGRGGDEHLVRLPTKPFQIASVTKAKRLSMSDGRQAAYIDFREVLADSPMAMKKALNGLAVDGVKELIVDLRFNQGGDILSVAPVAEALAGPRVLGRPAYTMRMTDSGGTTHNEPIVYSTEADPLYPGFERIVFLTSSKTASAAEWLIWSLSRYIPVATIGDTTYGKPYAMTLRIYDDMAYNVIDIALVDDAGNAPFAKGIVPTCAVEDGSAYPLGDAQEPLLKAALNYLVDGGCPA
jgi:carboxyl-terminal processing protease